MPECSQFLGQDFLDAFHSWRSTLLPWLGVVAVAIDTMAMVLAYTILLVLEILIELPNTPRFIVLVDQYQRISDDYSIVRNHSDDYLSEKRFLVFN